MQFVASGLHAQRDVLYHVLCMDKPSDGFEVLAISGWLQEYFPELHALRSVPAGPISHHAERDAFVHTMMVLDIVAENSCSLAARFAALCHDLGKGNTPAEILPRHIGHEKRGEELILAVVKRMAIPCHIGNAALVVARHHSAAHKFPEMNAGKQIKMLDDVHKYVDIEDFVLVCEADTLGRIGEPMPSHALDILETYHFVKEIQIVVPEHVKDATGYATMKRVEMLKEFQGNRAVEIAG